MATKNKDIHIELSSRAKDFFEEQGNRTTIGIVVSQWNSKITDNLLEGAVRTLIENGILEENIIVYEVPGAFELPLASDWLLKKPICSAVIAIGSVIRGETAHFDYVCQGVTSGIQQVMIKREKPISFCVLTDNTIQQARDRSGGKLGNKGEECALSCLEMIALRWYDMYIES